MDVATGELTQRPLSDEELHRVDAYWRAANYLTVGQIYLLDNPLLREPLSPTTSSHGCSGTGAPARAEPDLRAPQPGHRRRAT